MLTQQTLALFLYCPTSCVNPLIVSENTTRSINGIDEMLVIKSNINNDDKVEEEDHKTDRPSSQRDRLLTSKAPRKTALSLRLCKHPQGQEGNMSPGPMRWLSEKRPRPSQAWGFSPWGIHMEEGENHLPQAVLRSPHLSRALLPLP